MCPFSELYTVLQVFNGGKNNFSQKPDVLSQYHSKYALNSFSDVCATRATPARTATARTTPATPARATTGGGAGRSTATTTSASVRSVSQAKTNTN